ncbi:MAG: heavy-metal-associated domain-containing protein [Planctomycetes bacterium]|nr:heavy-metal-associated domain-containing protein [Planctomycetota bacterium]
MSRTASLTRAWMGGVGLSVALLVPWAVAQQATPPAAPAAAASPAAGVEDIVLVEADGEGLDKEAAIKAALRAALEKGSKTEIFSDTKVENFELMHDTILTRAEGIVTDYQIVKGPEKVIGGGTVKVWIKARVSKKALHDSWGAIQNVLNQMGRPKIMVHIVERIDGNREEQGILEVKIEQRLLKSGFDLVERGQIASVMEKEKADAAAEDNVAKLQAIAKEFGAQIFITGTANANQAGIEELYGVPFAFYNCDAQFKAYYTDTAKLLASVPMPQTRGGARGRKEYSPQAGKQALDNAAPRVLDELYQQVLSQWSTAISAGGELVLEVEGMKFAAANRLKKAIGEMKGVEKVNFELTKGIARFRINAKLSANDLAEKLSEGEFEKAMDINDVKLNRIQAKAKE